MAEGIKINTEIRLFMSAGVPIRGRTGSGSAVLKP